MSSTTRSILIAGIVAVALPGCGRRAETETAGETNGDHVVYLTDTSFATELAKADSPVIVDFYADWCGACRVFEPTFKQLSNEYSGRVRFFKVNVDVSPSIAEQFGVEALPTIVVLKDGQPAAQPLVGAHREAMVRQTLDRALTS